VPARVVREAAIRKIHRVAQVRAIGDAEMIEREFAKRLWFTRKPRYASRAEVIEHLTRESDWTNPFPSIRGWDSYAEALQLYSLSTVAGDGLVRIDGANARFLGLGK
jgi:hypothetical protein